MNKPYGRFQLRSIGQYSSSSIEHIYQIFEFCLTHWATCAAAKAEEQVKPIVGMHNIRPAGQMWPAKAFNLARKAQNLVYFACFFHKTSFKCKKHISLVPGTCEKKILAAQKIESWTPGVSKEIKGLVYRMCQKSILNINQLAKCSTFVLLGSLLD
jgi:hypothetical protein